MFCMRTHSGATQGAGHQLWGVSILPRQGEGTKHRGRAAGSEAFAPIPAQVGPVTGQPGAGE